jgi:hypothetical protein
MEDKGKTREVTPLTQDQWITLNVGGKKFKTTRSTLTKDKESMLAKMFGQWV